MENFQLQVELADRGLRLDQYLIKYLGPGVSRSRIQRLIKAGQIFVNQGQPKAHYKVRPQDSIAVNLPTLQLEPKVKPQPITLEIIFEDEDILIVEKPPGMVTHPAVGNYTHTLVNALLHYGCTLSTVNGRLRPGIVHRLDKDTSGLLIVAKNDFAHQKLAEQFRQHTIVRKYIALVRGSLSHNEGVIDYPLARNPENRQKIHVSFSDKGKPALTRFKVLKRYPGATLLELTPHTGRTHQLRVHLKFCGHPILGDSRYGRASEFARLALHATLLGITHPRTDKYAEFSSPAPASFYLKQ
ncbi:RluA family pseudouridine synthase [Candidatus Omnitrophota bacterium]